MSKGKSTTWLTPAVAYRDGWNFAVEECIKHVLSRYGKKWDPRKVAEELKRLKIEPKADQDG